jgi:hypothetical protein
VRRALVAGVLVALGLTLAGCTPHEGDKCSTGSYYTHSEKGHRVSLRCINERWRRA